MNRIEAHLADCIISSWSRGLGDAVMRLCRLSHGAPPIRRNVRFPATDIAWREFDLVSDVFEVAPRTARIILELKNGGIGYRSITQVLFYKHVLAPRHSNSLAADDLIFVLLGRRPNVKRWFGAGNLESDAEEFLRLVRPEYWPDPHVHVLSYDDLSLSFDSLTSQWRWVPANKALQPASCAGG